MGAESPGPVSDEQLLDFLVTDPQAVKDGRINPGALAQISGNGLSTIRADAPVEEYIRVLELLIDGAAESKNGERYFDSVLRFPASLVRYEENGDRFLCVYDTSLPEQPNHVDLMLPDAKTTSNNQCKKKQKHLRALLKNRVSGADLFDGALVCFMRDQ